MPLASVQEIKAGRAIQHGAMEFSTAPLSNLGGGSNVRYS